jgi:hypothetical protein
VIGVIVLVTAAYVVARAVANTTIAAMVAVLAMVAVVIAEAVGYE